MLLFLIDLLILLLQPMLADKNILAAATYMFNTNIFSLSYSDVVTQKSLHTKN